MSFFVTHLALIAAVAIIYVLTSFEFAVLIVLSSIWMNTADISEGTRRNNDEK